MAIGNTVGERAHSYFDCRLAQATCRVFYSHGVMVTAEGVVIPGLVFCLPFLFFYFRLAKEQRNNCVAASDMDGYGYGYG